MPAFSPMHMQRAKCYLVLGMVTLLGGLVSGCASTPEHPGPADDASTHESVGMTHGTFSPAVEELDRYVLVIGECMNTPVPRGYGHMSTPDRKKGGKHEYCERRCMRPYIDCKNAQGERVLEFSAAGMAVDWLKQHRQEILVGGIVVIAGVAFVSVASGGGALLLVPALWMAAS